MRIRDLIDPALWRELCEGPSKDELRAIENDKKLKKAQHKLRGVVPVDMPGNDASYPAF